LYQPWMMMMMMMMIAERSVKWMVSWGDRNAQRKPAPLPLNTPEIAHDLTRARSRFTAVASRQLTAGAMARMTVNLLVQIDDLLIHRQHLFLCLFLMPAIETGPKQTNKLRGP
jgi:hypothetical protein